MNNQCSARTSAVVRVVSVSSAHVLASISREFRAFEMAAMASFATYNIYVAGVLLEKVILTDPEL